MKKFKIFSVLITLNLLLLVHFSNAQNLVAPNTGVSDAPVLRCATDEVVAQRVANDPAYAAIYNQHQNNLEAGLYRSLDPCATPITIPLAFHFTDAYSCVDPDCLTGEVMEAIDALNLAFGDNSQSQLVQDLNAVCPTGYPLSSVSSSSCISFCLAEPRLPSSNQGLDSDCDPAITIGSFCGGIAQPFQNYCNGGAPPYYSGILNVFVTDTIGETANGGTILGISDGLPGAANGDGVSLLGSLFGADGIPCVSGDPLNTDGLFAGGATLIHEIGHYLGLRHIWGDDAGACTNTDFINDTPNQGDDNGALFPCPTVTPGTTTCADLPMSCGSNDYYHNYMDYTPDACMVMFTQEQAQVMNATANSLFGQSSAACFTDPIVLTSLCEQTICNPACDLAIEVTTECNAGEADYTVTVVITGTGGPYNIDESDPNDPLNTILGSLLTGVAAGTHTFVVPAGSGINVLVTDTSIPDCLFGEFVDDACSLCEFEVDFDLENAVCVAGADGTLLPQILITVTGGNGIVWIDQDGNATFDTGVDLDITTPTPITFPEADVTFDVYDGGLTNCFQTFTVETGNLTCQGVMAGESPLRVCTFTADADEVNYTCNGDGTATVIVTIDKIAGNITVEEGSATQITLMGDSATYEVIVPVGENCTSTVVKFADDGSDVSQNTGVSITSPGNIAADLTFFGTNVDGTEDPDDLVDFGIELSTVLTPVCGTLAQPDDGTAPITNFCEPTPPAMPTATQCAGLAGNIAIIDRGVCAFTDKIENAQACGATAVIICNCESSLADCNSDNNDQISGMVGTSMNPITIPTIFLSYNQCQEIYANLPVDMCIGAPQQVPCERTVNIDACAFTCVDICTISASEISTTDPTRICIDGVPDPINVTVDTDGGGTGAWVITDAAGTILALPAGPPFDLDGAGAGQCLIWYVNFDDASFAPAVGDDAAAIVAASACAFLSNPITVDRIEVTGATISTTDPLTICVDDDVDEPINVAIDDAGIGANGAWVITDASGAIVALPAGPPFILDGAGVGSCSIWWVNFDDPAFAPAVGDDAAAIVAASTCAALSNPITIVRTNCETCTLTMGSTISTTDPTTICVDGVGDPINVTVDVDAGGTGVWVITDAAGIILALPPGSPFDLDGAGAGTCLIWYANTEDGTFNPMVGDDAAAAVAASDCSFLSNSITVDRIEVTGATISSPLADPITICTNDDIDEPIDVNIDDAGIGANGAWVITDANGIILALPAGPPFILDGAGPGTCLIWWVNFEDPNFAPAVGDDAAAAVAAATCAALSNPITVNRDDTCGPCEDAITGTITSDEPTCDLAGVMVEILDDMGNPVTGSPVTIAADGSYSLSGPFECGTYTATLVAGSLPQCYTDLNGTTGPFEFNVDGDGTADGANFQTLPQVPTLSQWGLISLALLLMIFGAVKISATSLSLKRVGK